MTVEVQWAIGFKDSVTLFKSSILPCFEQYGPRSPRSNRKVLLREKRSQNSLYDKCFVKRSIKLWNILPEEVKQIKRFKSFKIRAKLELLQEKPNFPE